MGLSSTSASYLKSNTSKVRPITESAAVLDSLCPLQGGQVGPCSSNPFHNKDCFFDVKITVDLVAKNKGKDDAQYLGTNPTCLALDEAMQLRLCHKVDSCDIKGHPNFQGLAPD